MSALRFFPILALLAALTACAARPEECWICQRKVHDSVRTTLILASGKNVVACCPRCALHYQEEPANKVREIRVADYAGGGNLPFSGAFLVEGSDETPCLRHHNTVADESKTPMQVCYDRCMPSLIAFKEETAARAFAAEHGGTVYLPERFPGLPAPAAH
jgi:hypothetical protein